MARREYSYSRPADKPYKTYLSVAEMNAQIEKIIEEGFIPPTRIQKYQEGRTAIIVENELYGAGFIRTFEETNRYLERSGLSPLTKKEYTSEIHGLQNELGKQRTASGVKEAYRDRIGDIVADMEKAKHVHIDIKHFSTSDLYQAIKDADAMVGDGKSGDFYDYLLENIRRLRR